MFKPKKKEIESPQEELADEEEAEVEEEDQEEETEEEEQPSSSKETSKKPSLMDVLLGHEERLNVIEASLFRVKGVL